MRFIHIKPSDVYDLGVPNIQGTHTHTRRLSMNVCTFEYVLLVFCVSIRFDVYELHVLNKTANEDNMVIFLIFFSFSLQDCIYQHGLSIRKLSVELLQIYSTNKFKYGKCYQKFVQLLMMEFIDMRDIKAGIRSDNFVVDIMKRN